MITVLGAGVTGLTVGYAASEKEIPCTVIEKAPHVGGMAASFNYEFEGEHYTIDYGPHKIFTTLPRSLEFMKNVLGDDMLEQPKKSKIRLQGKYFDYPIKIGQVLAGLGIPQTAKFGASFITSKLSKENDATYKGYLTNRFGKKIYETIFRDLAQKVWGDPETLDFELAKTRLAAQSLPEMVSKLLLEGAGVKGGREISAKVFYYPKKGFGDFSDKMVDKIGGNGGRVLLSTYPKGIFLAENKVQSVEVAKKSVGGKETSEVIRTDFLFSTIPLFDLISVFNPKPPQDVLDAAAKLRYRSLILLFVVARKNRLFDDSFIFFPEKEFVFNRLSEQKAFSEWCVPKEKTVLCAEMSCEPTSPLYSASDQEVFDHAWPSLEKTGFIKKGEVAAFFTKRAKRVYPVYDVGFKKNLYTVLDYLDGIENLITLGRQGLFNYNNTDHCVDMGLSAFENASVKMANHDLQEWKKERERFENYVIVD